DPRADVAVEVLVEEQVVPPVRIVLEPVAAAEDGTPSGGVAQEDVREPLLDLPGNLEQVHQAARAGRALDFEILSVIGEVVEQAADEHHVDRQPDRSAPVRVSSEEAAVRFGGQIRDLVLPAASLEHVGVLQVEAGYGANPVRGEELAFVEELSEDA